jgi:hypothetical protein
MNNEQEIEYEWKIPKANIGYIIHKFTDEQLKPIWDEINKIKSNAIHKKPHNEHLAGNIENEYTCSGELKQYIENLVMPFVYCHDHVFNTFSDMAYGFQPSGIYLEEAWINFQKKYEFNPPHKHSGIYSFVIWLNLPFDLENELSLPHVRNANTKAASQFYFLYTNTLGNISAELIPVDRKMQNTLCLFPAKMIHGVHPFYTSDDYRITLSGNFHFNNKT